MAEEFRELELEIREPLPGHGHRITFTTRDESLVRAYNGAIDEVCNQQERLGFFHQQGADLVFGPNAPGSHGWEDYMQRTTKEQLEGLVPGIHNKAGKLYFPQ